MKSFDVGDEAVAAMRVMMPKLGASDLADVLRKAIALAKVATDVCGDDGVLTVVGRDGKHVPVALR